MSDLVFKRFLEAQYDAGMALAEQSDILALQPVQGAPPHRYMAAFHAKGLVQTSSGDVQEALGFVVGIWFDDSYLVEAHPARVFRYLGPHLRPHHPNIRPPHICAHLKPGTPLVALLYTLYDIWSYRLYAAADCLNESAAQYARNHSDLFPTDRRPLKRRTSALEVHVKKENGVQECSKPPTP